MWFSTFWLLGFHATPMQGRCTSSAKRLVRTCASRVAPGRIRAVIYTARGMERDMGGASKSQLSGPCASYFTGHDSPFRKELNLGHHCMQSETCCPWLKKLLFGIVEQLSGHVDERKQASQIPRPQNIGLSSKIAGSESEQEPRILSVPYGAAAAQCSPASIACINCKPSSNPIVVLPLMLRVLSTFFI